MWQKHAEKNLWREVLEVLMSPDEPSFLKQGGGSNTKGHGERFSRLPGVFRRRDFVKIFQPGFDFHLEEAGHASDGARLFAIFRREINHAVKQGAKQ